MAQLEARPVARISHVGDLPASATFPHQRDARKGRIVQQGFCLQQRFVACSYCDANCFLLRPASQSASRCEMLHRSRLDKTGGGRLLCRCPPLFYLVRLMGLESRADRWFSTGTESGPHVRQSSKRSMLPKTRSLGRRRLHCSRLTLGVHTTRGAFQHDHSSMIAPAALVISMCK